MSTVFIQLGSNKGDRKKNIEKALSYLEEMIGVIIKKSNIYETTPWRAENQDNYLNQVILLKTMLNPNIVLIKAMEIEYLMGRVRLKKWSSREIDIDILFYNHEIISKHNLSIPHKFLHERRFVLEPLNDIAPNFIHPSYNKSISELLETCSDQGKVKKYEV